MDYGTSAVLKTRDLLAASKTSSGPLDIDAFSNHHYGSVSQRCASSGMQTTAEASLSEQWLRRTDETLSFYKKLRDEFAPGKPFRNTETADAAWASNGRWKSEPGSGDDHFYCVSSGRK